MLSTSIRRSFVALIFGLGVWSSHTPAYADECRSSCASSRPVCGLQAMTSAKACLQECGREPGGRDCRRECLGSFRAARRNCRASRADCMTNCPPAATTTTEMRDCGEACGTDGTSCFRGVAGEGKSCLENCVAAAEVGPRLAACLAHCADGLRSDGGACLARLQGCLSGCPGPASGVCFDTVAMQCTNEPCGPNQPCGQSTQFCSPRCAAPQPTGFCFDRAAMQCTGQSCSPAQPCGSDSQACVPNCPDLPPTGFCFDSATNQCTDRRCGGGVRCEAPNLQCSLQCPPPSPPPSPTPAPPCSSVPCGGRCVVEPSCDRNGVCDRPSVRGQCVQDPSGACQCLPVTPLPTQTPAATPTPQCAGVPCGGACSIKPCPPGARCPEFLGQCVSSDAGDCRCAPLPQPTEPPRPTPEPQCSGNSCGGECWINPPCPDGFACPAFVIRGECRPTSAGVCQCVAQPEPTRPPTPGCTSDRQCNDNNGCSADRCVNGACQHDCLCLGAGSTCCPGPAAFCAQPCGIDASGMCGGSCGPDSRCESLPNTNAGCGCVSEAGGPCGSNLLPSAPVCAAGLVCRQLVPGILGVCGPPRDG